MSSLKTFIYVTLYRLYRLYSRIYALPVCDSTRALWHRVSGHPQGPLEDSPCDLRTTCEWNTTSVPIQLSRTWDSIRKAGNLTWPGSQVPSSQCQHWVTWAQSQRTPPRSLEDSFLDKPRFGLQTSGHLPCQRRGVRPAREGMAEAPGGAIQVSRSLWDQSA